MSNNSRTKKFFSNSIAAMGYQVLVMIAGFLTPKAMIDGYGSEINGLITSILQFISYFNLVEAGLSASTIYSLYKPIAENNHKEISRILVAARNFYYKSGYLFLGLTFILATIYPMFVKVSSLSNEMMFLLVIFLGVSGVTEFFAMAKYRTLLIADQKNYIISIASMVSLIFTTVIVITCSYLHVNIVLMRGLAILPITIRMIIVAVYVRRNYNFINYNDIPNNNAMNKRWDALFLEILGVTQKGTPIILATVFTNLKMVSVYSIYNMVIGATSAIFSVFTTGLSAAFGEIIAKGELENLQKLARKFEFIYYKMITCVYTVSAIMIMPFIRLYTSGVTDVDYDVPLIGFLFVLDGLMYNMKTPQGMLVISAGKYKETKLQTTMQAIIIVIVGIILAPTYGIEGILIASIAANTFRTIEIVYFVSKHITKLSKRTTYKRQLIMLVTFSLGVFVANYFNFYIGGYVEWIIMAVGVTLLVLAIQLSISLVFERKDLLDTIKFVHLYMKVLRGGK